MFRDFCIEESSEMSKWVREDEKSWTVLYERYLTYFLSVYFKETKKMDFYFIT